MKVKISTFFIYVIVLGTFVLNSSNAQDTVKVENKEQEKEKIQHGPKFVDEDGDGFNDNAPDHDGDGIPNGLDPDYKRPGKDKKKKFVDLDGDGIDDNIYNEESDTNSKGIGPQNKATSVKSGETKKSMKRKRTGKN